MKDITTPVQPVEDNFDDEQAEANANLISRTPPFDSPDKLADQKLETYPRTDYDNDETEFYNEGYAGSTDLDGDGHNNVLGYTPPSADPK